MDIVDAALLVLIFLFYGVGDVATTLYGIHYCNMEEGNLVMKWLFGRDLRLYQSLLSKAVTLIGVLTIYYVSRVIYSTDTYQIVWWISAVAIIGQGVRVTFLNWRDIRAAQ